MGKPAWLALIMALATVAAIPATAAERDTCKPGYVWREAFPGDHVCVDPAIREQVQRDNKQANARRASNGGPSGPDTCRQGYVWRQARPQDHVCVTPQTRAQTVSDNRQAAARRINAGTSSADKAILIPSVQVPERLPRIERSQREGLSVPRGRSPQAEQPPSTPMPRSSMKLPPVTAQPNGGESAPWSERQQPERPTMSAPAPSPDPTPALAQAKAAAVVVRVFFATDRNLTASNKPKEMFGGNRSRLSYGSSYVSIPFNHRRGELESPSIWKLEFREDLAKHVVLLRVTVQPKDNFFVDLAERIKASGQSSAFLFIHGYNVSFEDAARRTAQIWYDLNFDGAPVFYSWPSQGKPAAYTIDEQSIEWTQTNLKDFLEDFFNRSDAQNVYLIAHSMGNRALTRAVASLLAEKPFLRQRLTEVILTAPDIDADVFKRDIAPALTKLGRPITLYASSEDRALVASKSVHGYPRAGDSGGGLVLLPGIETIDATGTDTSFLAHSYFAETNPVLMDLSALVVNRQRAEQRAGLLRVNTQGGNYWVFKR